MGSVWPGGGARTTERSSCTKALPHLATPGLPPAFKARVSLIKIKGFKKPPPSEAGRGALVHYKRQRTSPCLSKLGKCFFSYNFL